MKFLLSSLLVAIVTSSTQAEQLRGPQRLLNNDHENDPVDCKDKEGWHDSYGLGCWWYGAHYGACGLYGDKYRHQGSTANDACCICKHHVKHPGEMSTYHTIENVRHEGECMALGSNSLVILKDCDDSDSEQLWEITTDDGYVRNKKTNQCIDGGAVHKGDLLMKDCPEDGANDDGFKVKKDGKLIKSTKANVCYDFSDSKNPHRVHWYACGADKDNQQWIFTEV